MWSFNGTEEQIIVLAGSKGALPGQDLNSGPRTCGAMMMTGIEGNRLADLGDYGASFTAVTTQVGELGMGRTVPSDVPKPGACLTNGVLEESNLSGDESVSMGEQVCDCWVVGGN